MSKTMYICAEIFTKISKFLQRYKQKCWKMTHLEMLKNPPNKFRIRIRIKGRMTSKM